MWVLVFLISVAAWNFSGMLKWLNLISVDRGSG